MSKPDAAIVLIRREDGRILAISRDENTRDWGFPGGGRLARDPDLAATAIRELREETGIDVPRVVPIFRGISLRGTRVSTYAPVGLTSWPARLRSKPFEGYVGWVKPEVLTSPQATYRAYAQRLFDRLGIQ